MTHNEIKKALLYEVRQIGLAEPRTKVRERAAKALVAEGKLVLGGTSSASTRPIKKRWNWYKPADPTADDLALLRRRFAYNGRVDCSAVDPHDGSSSGWWRLLGAGLVTPSSYANPETLRGPLGHAFSVAIIAAGRAALAGVADAAEVA